MEAVKNQKMSLTIKTSEGHKVIGVQQIIYVKSENKCSVIHLKDVGDVITYHPLKWYEEFLEKPHFCRCHHSNIVNCNYVEFFDHSKIILKGKIKIKMSRKRFDLFKENLELLEELIY